MLCTAFNLECNHCIFVLGQVGIQLEVLALLKKEVNTYEGHQRYVGLLQDEVKIKADLVYKKHTGIFGS